MAHLSRLTLEYASSSGKAQSSIMEEKEEEGREGDGEEEVLF